MAEHSEIGWAYGVVYDDLHACGCGYANARLELVRDVLRDFSHPAEGDRSKYRDPLTEWLLCLMDGAGLLEHGSSIVWSWLTDKGERFLAVLNDETSWDALLNGSVGYCECAACGYVASK